MNNAVQHYGASAIGSASQMPFLHADTNAVSTTTSLRQFRKKDGTINPPQDGVSNTNVAESGAHVARVAPHNHFPPRNNEFYRATNQNPLMQDYGIHQPVKYSEISEHQPNQHEQMMMQKQNLMMPQPQQNYSSDLHGHYKPPESQYFLNQQQIPKYNMRKYPSNQENDFFSQLQKVHPTMARSIMSEHHIRESQMNFTPNPMYQNHQSQQRYYQNSIQNTSYHSYPQHYNYNAQNVGYNNRRFERSISPATRRNMYPTPDMMNYVVPQKISPPSYHQFPEYAQHYQHRRNNIAQEFYPQQCRTQQYLPNNTNTPETPENRVTPSNDLKQFIENWADDEATGEGGKDQTLFIVNSEVQYLEIENGQYVLKEGVLENQGRAGEKVDKICSPINPEQLEEKVEEKIEGKKEESMPEKEEEKVENGKDMPVIDLDLGEDRELLEGVGEVKKKSGKRKKRIFSVDDIINVIGGEKTREGKRRKSIHATQKFLDVERRIITEDKQQDKEVTSTEVAEDVDVQYRSAIKIEENSVLLHIAGELVEINVNEQNGKKVITVVPISDTTVVDFNDNYETMETDQVDQIVEEIVAEEEVVEETNLDLEDLEMIEPSPIEILDTPINEVVLEDREVVETADLDLENLGTANLESTEIVETSKIENPSMLQDVETPKLQDTDVETPKLQDTDVETPKLQDTDVETSKLQDTVVETPKLQDTVVETPKLQDTVVETPKLQDTDVETPTLQDPKIVETMQQVPESLEVTEPLKQDPEDKEVVPEALTNVEKPAEEDPNEIMIGDESLELEVELDLQKDGKLEENFVLCTKAAKKAYDPDFIQTIEDQQQQKPKKEDDEEYVSFKELLKARKLRKMKKLQEKKAPILKKEDSPPKTVKRSVSFSDEKPEEDNKKRKLSLQDYNNRKRPPKIDKIENIAISVPNTADLGTISDRPSSLEDYLMKRSELMPIKRTMSIEESTVKITINNDWEDTMSPREEQCQGGAPKDFQGLLKTAHQPEEGEIIEEDPPKKDDLQIVKDAVCSKLSSLDLNLPKKNTSHNIRNQISALEKKIDNFSLTPKDINENHLLMNRFLNKEYLSEEEMKKIKQIIQYKRMVQHLKKLKSNEHDGTYEIREETNLKLHLKKMPEDFAHKKKKRRFRNLHTKSSSEESDSDFESAFKEKTLCDYSVVAQNCQYTGVPKLIIKRKVDMPQPVVRLERLDLDMFEKRNW